MKASDYYVNVSWGSYSEFSASNTARQGLKCVETMDTMDATVTMGPVDTMDNMDIMGSWSPIRVGRIGWNVVSGLALSLAGTLPGVGALPGGGRCLVCRGFA